MRMTKGLAGAFALLALPAAANAFCGFYVAAANAELYNDASQVVIAKTADRVTLSLLNNYKGDPKEFALVVPVPLGIKKQDVKVIKAELFAHLDQWSAPRLVEFWEQDPCFVPPPQRMYDNAYSDYMAGQYDIAIQGFNAYIASFPKSDKADDAQLNIGNSLYAAGKYGEAIAAFQKVISNYPQADSVAVAHYKMGVTYEALKQVDLARRSFETLTQKYPAAPEAILAKQRLDALNRK
jgi:tol-pal system protein YbgF